MCTKKLYPYTTITYAKLSSYFINEFIANANAYPVYGLIYYLINHSPLGKKLTTYIPLNASNKKISPFGRI